MTGSIVQAVQSSIRAQIAADVDEWADDFGRAADFNRYWISFSAVPPLVSLRHTAAVHADEAVPIFTSTSDHQPKKSGDYWCRCGVSGESFRAEFSAAAQCWKSERGSEILFGLRDVPGDVWRKY